MKHQQDFAKCSYCCPPLLSYSFLVSLVLTSHYPPTFGCLPLLLVPSTYPYSATADSLSALHPCYVPEPRQHSFPDFVYECNLLFQVLSGLLVPYLASSRSPQLFYADS